nr:Stf0 family sulfotransferase [uncultured Friedmanniella sp.]
MDSYLICATPRSGSTLLCGLLRSTGVAGRPESYFRRQSVSAYADEWGLPGRGDALTEVDEFVQAAVAAGSTGNGVFGARIMWGTMTELTDALSAARSDGPASALGLLTGAFGRTRFLHLRRVDTVAQAVSWARAEQTHQWHPGEERNPGGHEPHFDRDLIDELVHTITRYERAWQEWFAGQGLSPYEITYEDLAEDPVGTATCVLEHLGLVLPPDRTITVRDRRQADDLNADWIRRFRG